jgi:hypothetical protein
MGRHPSHQYALERSDIHRSETLDPYVGSALRHDERNRKTGIAYRHADQPDAVFLPPTRLISKTTSTDACQRVHAENERQDGLPSTEICLRRRRQPTSICIQPVRTQRHRRPWLRLTFGRNEQAHKSACDSAEARADYKKRKKVEGQRRPVMEARAANERERWR